ncbi:MAG TPA: UbiA family prenyltransferase [Verrucomicrobiae bacterium]|nr:UbiA family prenyltransferase [Verrucomicrobiae bacterium]
MSTPAPRIRTLLILGRVSNVPTVWSNCLAAWLLNGGGNWIAFGLLCTGATLLYVGGMFLNDAFDADFDRQFRAERPIPSGQIAERDVWWIGSLLIFFGWLFLFLVGGKVALFASLLVAAIVLYDAIHKHTEGAPFIMAACRFLLYLVAAAATLHVVSEPVFWHGLALAAYIVGLSFLARKESGQGKVALIPLLFLVAPVIANVGVNPDRNALSWIAGVMLLFWMGWCVREVLIQAKPNVGKVVAGLLAGIVLVDCAALPQLTADVILVFAGLFLLALMLQRTIPAT